MLAKHIQTAREDGPKAGFRSYMASSAPTARDRQAQIRSAGNAKAQFEAYCAIFGEQFGNGRVRTAAVEQHNEGRKQTLIERLAAKLGVSTGDLDALVEDEDDNVGVVVLAEPKPKAKTEAEKLVEQAQALMAQADALNRKPAKATPKVDKYAPKNPDENCSSGRLWKLNNAGLLTLRSKPGTPLTSGTAHTVLSTVLDD